LHQSARAVLGAQDRAARRRAANAATAKVHSRDLHTEIEGALLAVTADWTRQDPAVRYELIVPADGIVDVAERGGKTGPPAPARAWCSCRVCSG